jgi:hypothetical protein
MLKKILILMVTTLVLFSFFSTDSYAEFGVGLGPALTDVIIPAGQSTERTMIAYNPFDTNAEAEVIISDNLKDYVKADPETIFIEKGTVPGDGKVITLSISAPFWTLGDKDIQGEITLKGTGGMVSPAVGSTFYLHIKGISVLNLSLMGVGVVLIIVAIILFIKKRKRKQKIKTIAESITSIDFSPQKPNYN